MAGVWLAICPSSSAETLSQLLDRAQSSEPTYLGAKTGVSAAQARVDQAFGAMLPQVSATASVNYNTRRYITRSEFIPPAHDTYNGNSAQLTLTQPLWHYANIAGLREAESTASQAEYQLANSEQTLFAKLVSAWLDVLSANDNLRAMIGQEKFASKQWQVERRGAELGSRGQPQAEEAKAKYLLARSDEITAEEDVQVKLANLEQLVGPIAKFEDFVMRDGAQPANLGKDDLDRWLKAGEQNNPAVLAAQAAYAASDSEVSKQRASYQPTLDMVASYGKNAQTVGSFPGQNGYKIWLGSIGLQLNVPLYSGGTRSAKVTEAVALKEKAWLDVIAARRAARLAIKQAWFDWQTAHMRTEAGLQAIQAAELMLKAARRGKKTGLKMDLDVLEIEQKLAVAQRDWRKGRYDQIAAHVKLKAATGKATVGDVDALDQLFVPTSFATDNLAGLKQ